MLLLLLLLLLLPTHILAYSCLFILLSLLLLYSSVGGMFDSHKAGKNVRFVNALWSLQLFQLLLVLMAPAVFASAGYIGKLLYPSIVISQFLYWHVIIP